MKDLGQHGVMQEKAPWAARGPLPIYYRLPETPADLLQFLYFSCILLALFGQAAWELDVHVLRSVYSQICLLVCMDKLKKYLRDTLGTEKYMFLVRRRDDIRDGLVILTRNILRKLEGRPGAMCLITGPPRSGTTAVREWLGGHSKVVAFHESRSLIGVNSFFKEVKYWKGLKNNQKTISHLLRELTFRYYAEQHHSRRLNNKNIIIDKEPLGPWDYPGRNYAEFIQNVREVYPGIKLIYMIRDPKSTIWSMHQRKWGYSSTDIELREFAIEDYVDNWNICADLAKDYCDDENTFICNFNRLVSSPEVMSQEIFRFLGLDMHEPFQPRPTKNPDFSAEEAAFIAEKTGRRWKMLNGEVFS